MTLLSFVFRGHKLSRFIAMREIWLFTPSLNTDRWWYLINESDWETILRPGLRLEMSLNLNSYPYRSTLPCHDPNREVVIEKVPRSSISACITWDSLIQFAQPLPPWQNSLRISSLNGCEFASIIFPSCKRNLYIYIYIITSLGQARRHTVPYQRDKDVKFLSIRVHHLLQAHK